MPENRTMINKRSLESLLEMSVEKASLAKDILAKKFLPLERMQKANISICGHIQTYQPHVRTSNQNEQLFATHGTTFYFASHFLPKALRSAIVCLYSFFRTLDDLVDERPVNWQADAVRQELTAWQEWFRCGCRIAAPREPLGTSLAIVLSVHQIPGGLFNDFVLGLLSDLEPHAFADFHDLSRYCYQAAGTVGLATAHLLGVHSEQALKAATHLGIAMQLTNILRDIGSDLASGRIYLPQNELARFGSSSRHLYQLAKARRGPDACFRELMRYQIARARLAYAAGLHGCWLLPSDCRVPILLAGRLYQRILTQIELRDYDVLRKRVATSFLTKLREAGMVLLLAALWQGGEVRHSIEREVSYEN